MIRLLGKTVASAIGVGVASWLLDGIRLGTTDDSTLTLVGTALGVGLILALLDTVVLPVLKVLTCPLILLTLGLFTFVIAALMLWLTSLAAGHLGLSFHVDNFWWQSVLGAVVIAVCNALVPYVKFEDDD